MGITIRLCGGLGNQAWQYSMGLATAQRLGTDLKLNTFSFHSDPMRQYSLGLWQGVTEQRESYPPQPPIVKEQGLPYDQLLVDSIRDGDTLEGYYQSPLYCESVKEELRRRFVPKQPLTDLARRTLRMIEGAGTRSTFLTIRRTDYKNSSFHGVLGLDYYHKAVEEVAKKTDPVLFVFSDEPEWCEQNILGIFPFPTFICGNYDQTTAIHLGREDAELCCMFNCYNAICANSSYSSLAAWLGADGFGGTIVRPAQWFGPASNEDPRDICPPEWPAL